MEKRWISDFLGVGYRYTDIHMNILILFTDRKTAIKTWNENIHWWPDDQIILRFIEDEDYYWFILYQQGKNLFSKGNIGFFKKNHLTQNYLRFKKNFDEKTIFRFALYKISEKKIAVKDENSDNREDEVSKDNNYELNIFKRRKTIYDVKFLKINELEDNSFEYALIKNIDTQYA
ncbi:MAG TPA: hypothetical protein VIP29_01605 [Nitrososphaeraceae archaeon]